MSRAVKFEYNFALRIDARSATRSHQGISASSSMITRSNIQATCTRLRRAHPLAVHRRAHAARPPYAASGPGCAAPRPPRRAAARAGTRPPPGTGRSAARTPTSTCAAAPRTPRRPWRGPVRGPRRPRADLLGADLVEHALVGELAQGVVDRARRHVRPLVGVPAQQLAPHVVAVHRLHQPDQAENHHARGRHAAQA